MWSKLETVMICYHVTKLVEYDRIIDSRVKEHNIYELSDDQSHPVLWRTQGGHIYEVRYDL